jgi:hypothetical protein
MSTEPPIVIPPVVRERIGKARNLIFRAQAMAAVAGAAANSEHPTDGFFVLVMLTYVSDLLTHVADVLDHPCLIDPTKISYNRAADEALDA